MAGSNKSYNSSQFHYQLCLLSSPQEEVDQPFKAINTFLLRPAHILVAVMSLICNTLVLLNVIRCQRLRHPSMLILTSLSVTDLTFGLYALLREILFLANPKVCFQPIEEYGRYIAMFSYLATITNVALISRDRYLALSQPTWYHNHITKIYVYKRILLCWVGSAIGVLLLVVAERTKNLQKYFASLLFFNIVSISIILLNYIRFLIANRRNTRIYGINIPSVAQREKKMAEVVSMILLCFLFTVLPAQLGPLIIYAMKLSLDRFRTFNYLLMTINGFLNPLLNYGRNKDLRRALSETIKCNAGG